MDNKQLKAQEKAKVSEKKPYRSLYGSGILLLGMAAQALVTAGLMYFTDLEVTVDQQLSVVFGILVVYLVSRMLKM